jgi:RNA polymerase sigma-70 factor (ECF subfamily)
VVEDVAVRATESVDLARELWRLPIDQRVVLLLIDGQGFTHEEAATTLRVPVGTVGSRLSRARTAIRAALEGGLV